MSNKRSLLYRFNKKYMPEPNTGCWIWTASSNSKGYGRIGIGTSTSRMAHRVSYLLFKGEIPIGLLVCHSCDVPSCVNPDHLFLGTNKDNMNDMVKRNRHKNNYPKLNKTSALIIRGVCFVRL